jgi:hypothetical protein
MAEEETFDIYGDDDTTLPSSPSQQSGPKKRLRRERSSSAPPLISPQDEEDDGASTPRQKKVKEDDNQSGEDEDPFKEYDNHVPLLKGYVYLRSSIRMERQSLLLNLLRNLLLLNGKLLRRQSINMLLLHYTSVISIG